MCYLKSSIFLKKFLYHSFIMNLSHDNSASRKPMTSHVNDNGKHSIEIYFCIFYLCFIFEFCFRIFLFTFVLSYGCFCGIYNFPLVFIFKKIFLFRFIFVSTFYFFSVRFLYASFTCHAGLDLNAHKVYIGWEAEYKLE